MRKTRMKAEEYCLCQHTPCSKFFQGRKKQYCSTKCRRAAYYLNNKPPRWTGATNGLAV